MNDERMIACGYWYVTGYMMMLIDNVAITVNGQDLII